MAQVDNRIKYSINKNFFKSWSNDMAYTLGLLFADGNIGSSNKGGNIGRFRVKLKDKDVLEQIKKAMDSTHPIRQYSKDKYESWLLDIGNREMVKDLLKLGLTPNKSLTIKFPKIPLRYLSHFIRGYFDGDGSIFLSWRKRDKKYIPKADLCSGSKDFLNPIAKLFGITVQKHGKYFQLFFKYKSFYKFTNFIYKDLGLFMNRKYNKYLSIRKEGY